MFVGFDYGTSNCAMGTVDKGQARVLPLGQNSGFIPSTLHALERELISDAVYRNIADQQLRADFSRLRASQIQQAMSARRDYGLSAEETSCSVGQAAIDAYLDYPDDGYFIKSPKSFLGATGLNSSQIAFFEDVVTWMMMSAKQQAEQLLQCDLHQTVIGRPVNFQGSNEQLSNQQAIRILTVAAQRAGFKEIEFLFEPLAAGIDFETNLQTDHIVLVVDVGGGTTDCSVVKMGPSYRERDQREQDFLGHSGVRVGGNDLDIHLAMQALMPLFGLNSHLKNGLPMPKQLLWDAVAVNDVGAQKRFNSKACAREISQLRMASADAPALQHLQSLQQHRQSYQLVRSAEQCKIALSELEQTPVDLSYIELGLAQTVNRERYAQAIQRPLSHIALLMQEAVKQAGVEPDLIYVTGGTAKSPTIHTAIEQVFKDKPIVVGDHFSSVTQGLTVWAQRLFS